MSTEAEKPATHLQKIRAAMDAGRMRPARRMMLSLAPAEIANLLESLPPRERDYVWELVDPDDEGEVLVEVNDEVRAGLIGSMEADELVAATGGLEVDDLADLIADLPETVNNRVLRSMERLDRERLESVLAFHEDSAGGLMNTDTITVRPDVTADVVLRYLRMHGDIPERTDMLFVVNRYGKYLGTVFLTRLLTHDEESTVGEIMDTGLEGINANTPANEVASIFETLDLYSAPVVDDEGRLLGRITVDDVVDVIREEAEHSLMSMAGLDEEDDMFAPVIASARRRTIWLGVNLATAFIAAYVVGMFEATIQEVVALAVLMPVVASMGGIAGSQTLTLMIRGLALGHVERSNARWLMFKETAVGLLNGLIWSSVVAVVSLFWFNSWRLGGVIAAALVINLLIAAISGVTIPLLLKRMNIDPALAGSVVLTTVTDVVGFMSFLGLGALFLTG
ncbi:MAG: magnesium transporter [Gammaproteobacteria bacterium]|nr:magnesium transporter [Gammaproteobacteria bacterium]NNF62442.1 magnesium transporter [Gammaproteobacteria bacterium]NNM21389.1 magnesium transporter [Gammaproteobacteria bacterium]